jgi:muconolactone delta-isomerase
MNQYMIDINLPEVLTEEFMSLIPSHRTQVNRLLGRGVMVSYSLSKNRKKIWTVVNARSEEEVDRIVSSFPIVNFLNYEVYDLAFNNNVNQILPRFSLN